MHKTSLISFLLIIVLIGSACSTKPLETNTVQTTTPESTSSPVIESMSNPDNSEAGSEVQLSTSNDIDSLQKDLDNTDIESINSINSQIQSELSQ